jgi:hypothetical protein
MVVGFGGWPRHLGFAKHAWQRSLVACLQGRIGGLQKPMDRGHVVAGVIACHFVLIVPEERYLLDTFGAECAAYSGAGRRWLGRK